MSGLHEELELERLALVELEADALRYFQQGNYALWSDALKEVKRARAHIVELELAQEAS